ncbi:MFS transporter [Actinotignum sp. GS-2025b]|uniref:MFS transporter n=1 Tax=Actinotignum sp. GS-2025b TaxID=3427275 RepID=UPI003F460128
MKKRSAGLVIAIAVIILELIGGMQTYLNQLILPILAKDLHAQNLYGVIMGVSAIASMAGLPIGAALMNRMRLPRLLMGATVFLVLGACTSAAAPHISVYLLGAVIRGLAGSTLAMTSIGAVALGLSGRARRLTLAFSSASWVVSSVVGPAYAAWATHLLSWRWAMLLYLPLLLIARFVIALNLQTEGERKESPFSYTALLLIVAGVGITIIPASGPLKIVLMVIGVAVLGRVAVLLMPQGTFTQKTSRRAALAGMLFLTGGYFAGNELVSLTAHDLYQAGPDALGIIIMGGGLGWAVVGVVCGIKPAASRRGYQLRVIFGLGFIALAALFFAAWIFFGWRPVSATPVFCIAWTLAGIGIGIAYLDTLNIFFDDPDEPDGITIEEMASSAVIVESLASTMFIPLTTSIVALAFVSGDGISALPYGITWLLIAGATIISFIYLRHAYPARTV